ncbi:MAG: hypothetical protein K2N84_03245, partial [Clostridia bacterium]|nr:hypothetical protein [Clostridia bacterium]
VNVQTNYLFFLNSDGSTGINNRGNVLVDAQENSYASSHDFQDVRQLEKKYMHVAVQITYTYGGETFTTNEAVQSHKF